MIMAMKADGHFAPDSLSNTERNGRRCPVHNKSLWNSVWFSYSKRLDIESVTMLERNRMKFGNCRYRPDHERLRKGKALVSSRSN
jgi:hypothetical protein